MYKVMYCICNANVLSLASCPTWGHLRQHGVSELLLRGTVRLTHAMEARRNSTVVSKEAIWYCKRGRNIHNSSNEKKFNQDWLGFFSDYF